MLRQRIGEHAPDLGALVGVVDLVAAEALGDPRLRHALRVADRHAFGLEREIARGRRAGIEVLVVPHVRRHDHRAFAPVVALRLAALWPHQAEAFAREHDDVRARPMGVRLLIGANRELRDVAIHRPLRHREARMPAARAAFFRRKQWQVDGVGHEVGIEEQPLLLAFVGEIFRLAVEALLEVVTGVKNKANIAERVDDHRRVGHRYVARGLVARAVEVLVRAVERDGENRARLPLEGDAFAGVVPHGGGAAPVEHVNHFFKQLALGREALPRRDFAHVAIVRGTRRVMVQKHTSAAAARPGFQLDAMQVLGIERADDVEALLAHPPRIRGVLLGGELLRKIVRNGRGLHSSWLRLVSRLRG